MTILWLLSKQHRRRATQVAESAECRPGDEGRAPHPRNGATFAAKFGEDQLHHVVFAVVREINVNVRELVQRHALLIQKAAEVEAKANRANV